MTQSFNNNNNGQFVLSYELLYLLQWLVDHEAEALKKIIARAVRQGFRDSITNTTHDTIELQSSDAHIQNSIADFLSLLDILLLESTNEQGVKKSLERNMIPALNQIDSTICNNETVESSLMKASSKLDTDSNEKLQDALLKELLKQWKPDKKFMMN